MVCNVRCERGEKNVTETTLQIPKSVKKGGWGCSRHWNSNSPAACGDDHREASCPPVALDTGMCQSRYPHCGCVDML